MPFIGLDNRKPAFYCMNGMYIFTNNQIILPTTYFMSGVCPMETIVQFVLCEQAPTDKLYNHFRMAELLPFSAGHAWICIHNPKMI